MSQRDDTPKRPRHSARTADDKAARAAREAEALRQNLLKRKQQQRGRQENATTGGIGRPKPPGR
jgi:hypothetical protein